jgi:predicted phosphodiesterase
MKIPGLKIFGRGGIMVAHKSFRIIGGALLLICLIHTSALADTTDTGLPVRFAIIGDRTGANVPGIYEQIIEEIQRMRPDFVMTVGDQIEGYHDDVARLTSEWDDYKQEIKHLTMPIHLVPGNHDILSDVQEEVYRDQIGEPYYSFGYCDLHFIILDNGRWESSGELPEKQIAWLADDLDKYSGAKYTFVFMHKPFWYNSTALGKPDTLHSLFLNHGVDAVFTGHFHQYFAGEYDGIVYTNHGSSGGGTEPGPTGMMYHFCWVTVDEDDISIVPIAKNAVLPWSEVTADELRIASKIKKFGIDSDPIAINQDMKTAGAKVVIQARNLAAAIEVKDTLRWEIPDGWSVTPAVMPVTIAPDGNQKLEFQATCRGPLYPVPTISGNFPFDEGKSTSVSHKLRLHRKVGCTRAAMPPMIDGNIAEPIWANPEKDFFAPDGGEMPTEPVAFYFAYDEENLYIAARCYETVMDSMAASVVDHDGAIYAEDCIGLFIQPDTAKSVAYQIYFNPLGRAFDQKLTKQDDGYMAADRNWDGIYNIISIHGEKSWTVEAAIPLNQFGATGYPGKVMGINFRRKQARLAVAADWLVPIDYDPKTFGFLKME